MARQALLLPLLPLIVAVAACGEQGSYELRWSIACATGAVESCSIRTAKDCSDAGFDAVQVVASHELERVRALFPCFGPLGPAGQGPGLDAGAVSLEVSALSPGGQLLSGPVSVDAVIPGAGLVPVGVTLPRPPACSDGVDNDGDGMVDMLDPGCQSPTDTQE
jgi:hypothetical protein